MIYIFYHIYCNTTRTKQIVQQQLIKIMFSRLYERVDAIYCFLVGENDHIIQEIKDLLLSTGSKFRIADTQPNDTTYERFTLRKIPHYIQPEDKLLYIHSKGVKHTDPTTSKHVQDWSTYMEYYLIAKHEECLLLLDTYDTVGVNYQTVPQHHYSGNFWWCTGKHYLSLNMSYLDNNDYLTPEFFIASNHTTNKDRKLHSITSTYPVHHYQQPYPMSEYVDKSTS